MLLGWATGSEYHIEPKAFSRSAYWGFYFQDDWKITSQLTLNLGLRYDFDVPRWETREPLQLLGSRCAVAGHGSGLRYARRDQVQRR